MGLRGITWDGVDWINVAQDKKNWQAFVHTVMNFCVTQNAGSFWTSFKANSFS
jgi:hypothetical protein